MRKPVIAGNWKMNKTPKEAKELINGLKGLVKDAMCDVVVCPPFVDLPAVLEAVKGTNIHVGAQNVHFAESGAYTGEISAEMLHSMGVEYAIIGHSERRQYFGETDKTVNQRTRAAVEGGLIPIVCVGETLEERDGGYTDALVAYQTKIALSGLIEEQVQSLIIAYEPVWAIGTGKTATALEADRVCGIIRDAVAEAYGNATAQAVRIQYGGSMNPGNARELMAQKDIDGGLIGGASLKPEDFSRVVNYDKN